MKYYGGSREAYAEYRKTMYRKDPRTVLLQNARRRAKEKGIDFSITKEDISVPETCPLLGIPITVQEKGCQPNSPSLDRIDPNLGYVKGNVWVISNRANFIKRDASVAELQLVLAGLLRRQDNEEPKETDDKYNVEVT